MTPAEAVADLMDCGERRYVLGKWDCAVMVADYIEALCGERPELPAPPLTARKVVAAIGRPDRDGCGYGSVLLAQETGEPLHLGIHIGYGMLTLLEKGGLAIGGLPFRFVHWRSDRWAR